MAGLEKLCISRPRTNLDTRRSNTVGCQQHSLLLLLLHLLLLVRVVASRNSIPLNHVKIIFFFLPLLLLYVHQKSRRCVPTFFASWACLKRRARAWQRTGCHCVLHIRDIKGKKESSWCGENAIFQLSFLPSYINFTLSIYFISYFSAELLREAIWPFLLILMALPVVLSNRGIS